MIFKNPTIFVRNESRFQSFRRANGSYYIYQKIEEDFASRLWLLPGKNITGEGIILKIPGFVVDIITPQTHQSYSSSEIKIQANIVMMCGCPITQGGLWDANQYEVTAILKSENIDTKTIKMEQEGGSSNFTGSANLEKGSYKLIIQAFDPLTGNTGIDRTTFMVN